MKLRIRVLVYLLFICACAIHQQAAAQTTMNAQGTSGKTDDSTTKEDDPCIPLLDQRYCFTLDPMSGLVNPCEPDTSYLGLGSSRAMESHALAINYTGNLYSPHQVEAYFDRRRDHDFIFANAYNLFRTDPSQQVYYNTRIPITIINYAKSGSNLQENDHLRLSFAGNFNKETGIGTKLDYVYARGEYMNTANKPLRWTSYAYYEGEQYKAYANFNLSKLANQEGGGITDRGIILNPDNYDKNATDKRNMATKLNDTWNETDTRQVHFQHNYNLGKWEERLDKDSTIYDEFIPVASIFHSIDYEYMHHNFIMRQGAQDYSNPFFADNFYDNTQTHDSTSYRNFSTYAGIQLNEGFNKYSQFGISAFIGFEHQGYTMLQDTLDYSFIERNHSSNNIWVGGQMSRNLSSALTFVATAKTAISGDKAGDIDINGTAQTVIGFGRRDPETGLRHDSLIIKASGQLRNGHVSYMLEHYFGNHLRWKNRFETEKQVRLDGSVTYPRTGTTLRLALQHITNFHYFGTDGLPKEYGKQLEIMAFEARQTLKAGKWLTWDNAVLFQTSNGEDDGVLSLPMVSVQSDLSFNFCIARTLHIQAGVAGYYYTKYYAPDYQPATQQFCTQRDIKCGNYPLLNGYVNCNLKRIKFFLTMHNLLDGTMTNDAFLMPYYPIQSRRMEYGIIIDLQN